MGNTAKVQRLLKEGADVNAKGDKGKTALILAVEHGRKETVKLLIENHADVNVKASGIENLKVDGPLMILSNHPGAYDSVAIGSQMCRKDFRIIAGEIPLYFALPSVCPLLIYAPHATDTAGRMLTLRTAIEHLRKGGSMLHFGAGTIEPDPAVQAGAVDWLSRWSRLELFRPFRPRAPTHPLQFPGRDMGRE